MDLMPLADRLEAQGFGTKGKDIFIHMIPADSPKGVLLREPLRGTPIDYELPGYFKTTFRVIARAPSYQEGSALINAVIPALTVQNSIVGTMSVRWFRPKAKPVPYSLSDGNLIEFAVEFEAVYNDVV